jgi:predicted lipoprotein
MKLGEPLGITDCDASQCPEAIESPWAEASKENVLANLIGFQILFLGAEPGTDALGFDDLLVDMGASDVAADMAQATEAAISATEAVPGSFVEALEQDPASMEAAHSAIQVLTDLLKTDFVSVLELELPDRAAGDND